MTIVPGHDVRPAPTVSTPEPWLRHDLDLSSCDREPIHVPGSIQPQGALLTVRPADFLVTQASANLASVLSLTAGKSLGQPLHEVLGRQLHEVLGQEARLALEDFVSRDVYAPNNVFPLAGPANSRLSLRAHRTGHEICVEIEAFSPGPPGGRSSVSMAQTILVMLAQAANLDELCALAAHELKALSGYDRVMVYRFDEHGNGKVIGEALEPGLLSYLGLHYPATDIPVQARQIFLQQRVRLIADVAYVPIPILSDRTLHDGTPLDMTLCSLRGVSPTHLEYLCNMGAVATFAVALSSSRKMWGLIVGHHGAPRWMDTEHRAAVDIIGQMLGMLLKNLETSELQVQRGRFDRSMRSLGPRLAVSEHTDETLAAPETDLLQVTRSDGALIRIAGHVRSIGTTPPPAAAARAMALLGRAAAGDLLAVDDLGLRYPELAACTEAGSGAMLLPLSPETDDAILWFRREALQATTWGGDPNKRPAIDAPADRISPRKSFDAWRELVRGHSLPWHEFDLTFARDLLGVIRAATAERKKVQQRRELERSNTDLEEFAYIASHDLKEPLRGIANNARFLLEDYSERLDQAGINRLLRLGYLSQRMEQLINDLLHFSYLGHPEPAVQRTDLNAVIRDIETMSETTFRERNVTIELPRQLPSVTCNRTRVTEVFRNLITNAIKYNDSTAIRVEIGYGDAPASVDGMKQRTFYVKDNGIGIEKEFHEDVFRIFKRLNSEDDGKKGTGVGLTFVRRIVERGGGRVWLESSPGQGSTFFFTMTLGE